MKKKVLSCVMMAVTVLSLCACGGKKETTETAGAAETEQAAGQENGEEGGKFTFCVDEIDMNDHRESWNSALFHEKFTLPIDIMAIDDFCAPYSYNISGEGSKTAKTMEEVINSGVGIRADDELIIWLRRQGEENEAEGSADDETLENVEDVQVIFKNYSEEEKTIKECYDQGWWYLEVDVVGPAFRALNIEMPAEYEDKRYIDGKDNTIFYNAMIDQLGAPTEILDKELFDGGDSGMEAYPIYYLIYGYEDYIIEIGCSESIMEEYDAKMVDIEIVTYYGSSAWEAEKSSRQEQ